MEHHLDEGMKEVLVYSRTNTDGPRRPRESSELVEVDLAGSQSRLALGTDSPLSHNTYSWVYNFSDFRSPGT